MWCINRRCPPSSMRWYVIFKWSLHFTPLSKETRKLVDQGINIIIALGHSGYEKDKEIARRCPDVDLVVGGQSHTFLYSGKAPSKEVSEGPYPTIVVKPDGRKVPVVQAYAYTKYLGNLLLEVGPLNLNHVSLISIVLPFSSLTMVVIF